MVRALEYITTVSRGPPCQLDKSSFKNINLGFPAFEPNIIVCTAVHDVCCEKNGFAILCAF